jgi:hypothetical protein
MMRTSLHSCQHFRYNHEASKEIIRESKLDYVVELGYNVMKGTEYCVLLQTRVVITEQYNVMVNSEELISATEYLML